MKTTVLTPTYNRGYILERLYQSLCSQNCKEFEWIIVDDGSEDVTEYLIQHWQQEAGFDIKYIYQDNGGKHRAVNHGVRESEGEALFIVDSDDQLTQDAIEWVNREFIQILHNNEIAGISGNCISISDGSTMYGELPLIGRYEDLTNFELIDRLSMQNRRLGDRSQIYKTEMIRKYPFPVFDHEKYLSENSVWNAIASDGYKLRWINKGIYYADYLSDGLTKRMGQLLRENPYGWAYCIRLEKHHYGLCSNKVLRQVTSFYEENSEKMPRKQLCELLDLKEEELISLEQEMESIQYEIRDYLINHNIKNFAVYGYGMVGKRFVRYLEKINIRPSYVIDRSVMMEEEIKMYQPDDELPPVDGVCIAIRYVDESLKKEVCNIMGNAYVWEIKDLCGDIW